MNKLYVTIIASLLTGFNSFANTTICSAKNQMYSITIERGGTSAQLFWDDYPVVGGDFQCNTGSYGPVLSCNAPGSPRHDDQSFVGYSIDLYQNPVDHSENIYLSEHHRFGEKTWGVPLGQIPCETH